MSLPLEGPRPGGGRVRLLKIEGTEFVRRYLRHVLPQKMHSVRHYGFCRPAAREQPGTGPLPHGMTLVAKATGANRPTSRLPRPGWSCACCGAPCARPASCPPPWTRPPLHDARLAASSVRLRSMYNDRLPPQPQEMLQAGNEPSCPHALRSRAQHGMKERVTAPTEPSPVQVIAGYSLPAARYRQLVLPLSAPRTRPPSNTKHKVSPYSTGLFNHGCICWLRFAPQQYTLLG